MWLKTCLLTRKILKSGLAGTAICCAGFLENALVRTAPGDLQGAALEAILEIAATAPADFAGGYRSKASWLQGFLAHVNPAGKAQYSTDYRICSLVEHDKKKI